VLYGKAGLVAGAIGRTATMLKLRTVRTSGDWDDYWRFHLAEERRRVHESRYAAGRIPLTA
jgi:hypothetical protein